MKNLILSAIVMVLCASCITPQMITGEKHSSIIEVKGTKSDLYIKANEWMVRAFNNSKSVIQFQDKEAGKIIGKYLLNEVGMNTVWYQTINAIVTINVKDNAARIEIEPTEPWKYSPDTILDYSMEKAKSDMNKLAADFKNYMLKDNASW